MWILVCTNQSAGASFGAIKTPSSTCPCIDETCRKTGKTIVQIMIAVKNENVSHTEMDVRTVTRYSSSSLVDGRYGVQWTPAAGENRQQKNWAVQKHERLWWITCSKRNNSKSPLAIRSIIKIIIMTLCFAYPLNKKRITLLKWSCCHVFIICCVQIKYHRNRREERKEWARNKKMKLSLEFTTWVLSPYLYSTGYLSGSMTHL